MNDPDHYDDVAEILDRYSERTSLPITECLMEMTGVRPGDRVLDVACGSGIAARRAASIAGPTGWVVGIDYSPGQVSVAKRRAMEAGHLWANFVLMDAMHLAFADGSFDVVVAQFPHFPDRRQCIGEMFRVLKKGGRFAICNGGGGTAVWPLKNAPPPQPIPRGGIVDGIFMSCLAKHFPEVLMNSAGNAPVSTGLHRLRLVLSPILTRMPLKIRWPQSALTNELRGIGFAQIAIWSYEHVTPFKSAEAVLELESVRTSLYRMRRDGLDPEHVKAFEDGYLHLMQIRLARYGVLGLTTGAVFGVGNKPEG
jgi:SAM-dependent methyltransferase